MSVSTSIARSVAMAALIFLPLLAGAETPQERLETIMAWWPGDYNNDAQLQRLEAEGKPIWRADGTGEGGHIEVTSHYRKIEMPDFGEHVLYVEETKHGDPASMFRQRIYTMSADEAGQVRVKLWYFKDREKYVGAYRDLSMLDDLTPEAMSPLKDDCDLIAVPSGDKYHMPMPQKLCAFGANYFDYQVLLGKDSFWFRDRIKKVEDDSVIESAGDFSYHELDRIN